MKLFRFVPLIFLLVSIEAHAYVVKVQSGNLRRWNLLTFPGSISTNVVNPSSRAVRYFIASDAYSPGNKLAEQDAVRAAFAQWQSVSGTNLKFEDAGLVNPPVDVNTSDNRNIVYWAKNSTLVNGGTEDISGATGVAYQSFDANNNILEADIVFNGVEEDWFTDYFAPNTQMQFVECVALHEIGHFIGLAHSPVGGATMLHVGNVGVDVSAGLSDDDIAAVRHLYGTNNTSYGAIRGTVRRNGSTILGAGVYVSTTNGNMVAGTVTDNSGNYLSVALQPGTYTVWSAPLEPSSLWPSLVTGPSIQSPTYNSAVTSFLVSTTALVTVTAGQTNVVNLNVLSGTPAFYMGFLRRPTLSFGTYSMASLPIAMTVGQSNYYIGVVSPSMPTNNATLTVTGDGLTVGATAFRNNLFTNSGKIFHAVSVPISVSSNATPGLRSVIVQQGTNVAIAHGFFEIQPVVKDYNFDALDDAFQRTYFSPFTQAQAAPGADVDSDTFNNGDEYIAGTNPTNALSRLIMLSPTNTSGGVAVRWESVDGKQYQVWRLTNAVSGAWQAIGSPVTASGPTSAYIDPATDGTGIYRVQVLP